MSLWKGCAKRVKPLITVDGLCVNYKVHQKAEGLLGSLKSFINREYIEIKAVENLDLFVMPGEILGLLGPNGAGKSTVLKVLSGVLWPDTGTIDVLGFTPYQRKKQFLKSIALVSGQRFQLWPDLPALESFKFHQLLYEVSNADFNHHLNSMANMLNVEHRLKTPVRQLSLGEKIKMELILAFIHNPKVVFLDEPTIGLDFISQNNIIEFLKEYNKNTGRCIILTSHYIKDIEKLTDRVQMINQGRTKVTATLNELITEYSPEKIVEIQLAEPLKTHLNWGEYVPEEINPYTLVWKIKSDCVHDMLKTILPLINVCDVTVKEPPLENVFTRFY
jgi:ABC-2 type transport system ATP-binding protein